MDYLLDTTVLIDVSRGQEIVLHWLLQALEGDAKLYLSPVTIAEYLSGIPPDQARAASSGLKAYTTLDLDFESAALAATYHDDQARQGFVVSTPDAFQAALAQRHRLVLATSNGAHFRGIDQVDPRTEKQNRTHD